MSKQTEREKLDRLSLHKETISDLQVTNNEAVKGGYVPTNTEPTRTIQPTKTIKPTDKTYTAPLGAG